MDRAKSGRKMWSTGKTGPERLDLYIAEENGDKIPSRRDVSPKKKQHSPVSMATPGMASLYRDSTDSKHDDIAAFKDVAASPIARTTSPAPSRQQPDDGDDIVRQTWDVYIHESPYTNTKAVRNIIQGWREKEKTSFEQMKDSSAKSAKMAPETVRSHGSFSDSKTHRGMRLSSSIDELESIYDNIKDKSFDSVDSGDSGIGSKRTPGSLGYYKSCATPQVNRRVLPRKSVTFKEDPNSAGKNVHQRVQSPGVQMLFSRSKFGANSKNLSKNDDDDDDNSTETGSDVCFEGDVDEIENTTDENTERQPFDNMLEQWKAFQKPFTYDKVDRSMSPMSPNLKGKSGFANRAISPSPLRKESDSVFNRKSPLSHSQSSDVLNRRKSPLSHSQSNDVLNGMSSTLPRPYSSKTRDIGRKLSKDIHTTTTTTRGRGRKVANNINSSIKKEPGQTRTRTLSNRSVSDLKLSGPSPIKFDDFMRTSSPKSGVDRTKSCDDLSWFGSDKDNGGSSNRAICSPLEDEELLNVKIHDMISVYESLPDHIKSETPPPSALSPREENKNSAARPNIKVTKTENVLYKNINTPEGRISLSDQFRSKQMHQRSKSPNPVGVQRVLSPIGSDTGARVKSPSVVIQKAKSPGGSNIQRSKSPGPINSNIQRSKSPGPINSNIKRSKSPGPINSNIQGSKSPGPINSNIQGSKSPGPINSNIQGSKSPGPINSNIQGSKSPGPINSNIQGSKSPGPINSNIQRSKSPGPINSYIQRSKSPGPINIPAKNTSAGSNSTVSQRSKSPGRTIRNTDDNSNKEGEADDDSSRVRSAFGVQLKSTRLPASSNDNVNQQRRAKSPGPVNKNRNANTLPRTSSSSKTQVKTQEGDLSHYLSSSPRSSDESANNSPRGGGTDSRLPLSSRSNMSSESNTSSPRSYDSPRSNMSGSTSSGNIKKSSGGGNVSEMINRFRSRTPQPEKSSFFTDDDDFENDSDDVHMSNKSVKEQVNHLAKNNMSNTTRKMDDNVVRNKPPVYRQSASPASNDKNQTSVPLSVGFQKSSPLPYKQDSGMDRRSRERESRDRARNKWQANPSPKEGDDSELVGMPQARRAMTPTAEMMIGDRTRSYSTSSRAGGDRNDSKMDSSSSSFQRAYRGGRPFARERSQSPGRLARRSVGGGGGGRAKTSFAELGQALKRSLTPSMENLLIDKDLGKNKPTPEPVKLSGRLYRGASEPNLFSGFDNFNNYTLGPNKSKDENEGEKAEYDEPEGDKTRSSFSSGYESQSSDKDLNSNNLSITDSKTTKEEQSESEAYRRKNSPMKRGDSDRRRRTIAGDSVKEFFSSKSPSHHGGSSRVSDRFYKLTHGDSIPVRETLDDLLNRPLPSRKSSLRRSSSLRDFVSVYSNNNCDDDVRSLKNGGRYDRFNHNYGGSEYGEGDDNGQDPVKIITDNENGLVGFVFNV